jgi:hypothetical protein
MYRTGGRSPGGGYCDCGDTEAWKSHPHCRTHAPAQSVCIRPTNVTSAHKQLLQSKSGIFVEVLVLDWLEAIVYWGITVPWIAMPGQCSRCRECTHDAVRMRDGEHWYLAGQKPKRPVTLGGGLCDST